MTKPSHSYVPHIFPATNQRQKFYRIQCAETTLGPQVVIRLCDEIRPFQCRINARAFSEREQFRKCIQKFSRPFVLFADTCRRINLFPFGIKLGARLLRFRVEILMTVIILICSLANSLHFCFAPFPLLPLRCCRGNFLFYYTYALQRLFQLVPLVILLEFSMIFDLGWFWKIYI